MITIQKESYKNSIEEMKLLYPRHYEELSRTKQFPLNPQYETYLRLEEAGILHTIIVRDDKKLIGYILAMVVPDLHYGGLMCAEDIYYLIPEYRGRMIGVRLFRFFEEEMKKLGVLKIAVTTKIHSDNSTFLEYLGFKQHEKILIKVLGE